ncbi:MAG TPA: cytochrome c3 family protein [Longimicrobiales bacterium]|nr:cytochrome c3 family protein [Longimicrobiales bacterium]
MALALAVAAPVSAQTIEGSAHDFSGETWAVNGEICNVCHTPHAADITVTAAPLWNHDLTTTDWTGNLYGGYDMQSSPSTPTGSSLLCLSCHDGTVALDAFGGGAGTSGTIATLFPARNIGTTLADDHPVGIDYTVAFAGDNEIRDPTADPGWAGSGITAISEVLDGGITMECASCHDVHNNGATGAGFLLRAVNTGSDLCLGCHIK